MRLATVVVSCVLLAFGFAFPKPVVTTEQTGNVAPIPAPQCVGCPSPACCGADCKCDPCECDVEAEPQEDLSSHIGKLVTRSSKPGVWRVVDAWRDDAGVLMYRYRLEQSTATNSCPGGVCPQPMGTYDGTSGWTYPGDIVDHLMNDPKHFVPAEQIIGKTKDELEAMHDSLHEGGQALRLQSNNCPGGVCPQPSVQRRGLFRWRR